MCPFQTQEPLLNVVGGTVEHVLSVKGRLQGLNEAQTELEGEALLREKELRELKARLRGCQESCKVKAVNTEKLTNAIIDLNVKTERLCTSTETLKEQTKVATILKQTTAKTLRLEQSRENDISLSINSSRSVLDSEEAKTDACKQILAALLKERATLRKESQALEKKERLVKGQMASLRTQDSLLARCAGTL